jgi:hypothetical protein
MAMHSDFRQIPQQSSVSIQVKSLSDLLHWFSIPLARPGDHHGPSPEKLSRSNGSSGTVGSKAPVALQSALETHRNVAAGEILFFDILVCWHRNMTSDIFFEVPGSS